MRKTSCITVLKPQPANKLNFRLPVKVVRRAFDDKSPEKRNGAVEEIGTVAIYGISGCAIRGTSARQRPHSSFTSNKRYNADILGACSKLHSFDEWKALIR
jgi:hypothetical protein